MGVQYVSGGLLKDVAVLALVLGPLVIFGGGRLIAERVRRSSHRLRVRLCRAVTATAVIAAVASFMGVALALRTAETATLTSVNSHYGLDLTELPRHGDTLTIPFAEFQ